MQKWVLLKVHLHTDSQELILSESHKVQLSDADCLQSQQIDMTLYFHEDP